MKKKNLLALSLVLLVSCNPTPRQSITQASYFGLKNYRVCTLDENGNINNIVPTLLSPFNTEVVYYSFFLDTEAVQIGDLLDETSSRLERLSVCFDRHNMFVDKEGNLVHNLAYLNSMCGSTSPITLEEETYNLLKEACTLTSLTEGAFNLFIGELSAFWDNYIEQGQKGEVNGLPSNQTITDILEYIPSYTEISDVLVFDDATKSVTFNEYKSHKVSVTFGGIAKGYATDLLKESLNDKHILISAGSSSIASYGDSYFNTWNVSIRNPRFPSATPDMSFFLRFRRQGKFSLSTSGDYQNYFLTEDGTRIHHIIDPVTGFPSTYHRSVSVVGESGLYCDALSTALMTLSLDEGKALVTKLRNGNINAAPIFMDDVESSSMVQCYTDSSLKDYVFSEESSLMEIKLF